MNINGILFAAEGKARTKWLLLGATVMGVGIWAMHFIGILATHFSAEAIYSTPLIVASIFPAILASGIAFIISSRPEIRKSEILAGAVLITFGLLAMHYTGMASMQLDATTRHDSLLFLLSAMVALATSFLLMFLLFYSRNRHNSLKLQLISAALITLGVSAMHYISMAAISFEVLQPQTAGSGNLESNYTAFNVGIGMALILASAVLSIRSETKVKSLSDDYDRQFLSVIESANDGIIVTDAKGFIVQWNYGAQCLFGYTKEQIICQDVRLLFPKSYQSKETPSDPSDHIGKTIELTALNKAGSQLSVELSTGTWKTAKGVYYSLIIRDITDRKAAEEKISNLVYLDSLTGLPNRRLFSDRLESTIAQAIENETMLAVLYLDLDQFKLVNDTYGHQTGDRLLLDVAERINSCLTKNDTLARIGGDEFILLLPNADYSKAESTSLKILEALNKPFIVNNEAIFTTPSIGASLFPADGKDSEILVKNADIAMYRVKEEGKNHFQFFTFEMNELVSRKSKIALSIRKGLELGEFTVHYQPQFDIETEEIIGVEALVRWQHTKWGPISPAEFIPIAEENGMILYIGEFVLRTACKQNKDWQDAGLPSFRMAVNISAKQFSHGNIAQVVTSALDDAGLAPEFLELELTESIIQGATSAISKMQKLKAMGIHLSIDDFGTGYSSLSYLKLFPVDTLKIDQHFTRNIHNDSKDAALVDTIIQMAHNLELNVIAEGVETLEQLTFLKDRQCNQAQGYYFQKPLPPEKIEELYMKV